MAASSIGLVDDEKSGTDEDFSAASAEEVMAVGDRISVLTDRILLM
jgi:hypothetical protein